jgi:hypothetical protein
MPREEPPPPLQAVAQIANSRIENFRAARATMSGESMGTRLPEWRGGLDGESVRIGALRRPSPIGKSSESYVTLAVVRRVTAA